MKLGGKKSYYSKLLMTVAVLSVIPSGIVTFINSRISLDVVWNNAKETNKLYLKQMGNSVEIVVDGILNFSNFLAVDRNFRYYTRFSDKEYFENFPAAASSFSERDYKRYYDYLNTRRKINETLTALSVANEFIESIYFLDPTRNTVFSTDKLPQPLAAFPDKDWYEVLRRGELLPHIMSSRVIEVQDHVKKTVISVISRNSEDGVCFVVNLGTETLYKKIISGMNWNPEDVFFILSKSGAPLLFSPKDRELIETVSALAKLQPESESDVFAFGKKEYLVSRLTIEPYGWVVYSAADAERIKGALRPLRMRVFLLSLLFFPVTLLLALFLAKRLYAPIKSLTTYAGKLAGGGGRTAEGDLGLIWDSLLTSESRERALAEKLEESLPAYRDDFLRRLLTRHHYTLEEVRERLGFIGSTLPVRDLDVLAILPETPKDLSSSVPDRMIFSFRVEEVVRERFSAPCEILAHPSGELSVIFGVPEAGLKSIFPLTEGLLAALKERLGTEFSAGIGSPARSILDLARSAAEAADAVRHRSLAGTGHVISYGDLKVGETNLVSYDAGTKALLLRESIKQRNAEEALRALDDVRRDLSEPRQGGSYLGAKRVYVSLLSEALNALTDLGLDLGELAIGADPYEELAGLRNLEDLDAWTREFIAALIGKVSSLTEEKKNKRIEEILRIVQNECGQDINLNIVADRMNLNPSYASRLFKEHMKVSFIDYLTDVRMKKAMSLLKETDLKVSEIAAKVGYFNGNYFIRIFKKKVGRTPAEFRRFLQ